MFDVLKSFETMKENRRCIDDNQHRLTTTERQVQWLNITYITNLFYDIISVLKWLDFARPEGFDMIYLLMTKLQTGRNYLLINRIKSKKNPRQITSNKDINSLVYITSEISNFLFWFQKEIIDIWVIFFFLRKVISKVLTW